MNATLGERMMRDVGNGPINGVSVTRLTVPGLLVISLGIALVFGGLAIGRFTTQTDDRLTAIEKDLAVIKTVLGVLPSDVPQIAPQPRVLAAPRRRTR